jgi:flavin-dependent dehydrogenase
VTSYDVAVVGGGPAGLAAAIEVASRGHSCVLFERASEPVDKACGEGLMPAGLAALDAWKVLLAPEDCAPFEAIRYVQEDGRHVDAMLHAPGGLGIRRVALRRALARVARESAAELREGCAVHRQRAHGDGVEIDTDAGAVTARLLVAADGLHSPLRRAAGLGGAVARTRRFGLRQHFALEPWDGPTRVEVHFAAGVEAYVTPAGSNRIGVAFLWEDGRIERPISFAKLLDHFPRLRKRLDGAPADSRAIGAGPLLQRTRGMVRGRVLLLGDAAGYVDAITGEGLTLAFDQARRLGRLLPEVLHDPSGLKRYERESKRAFRTYARLASALVALAGRPALRRAAIDLLVANPNLFGFLLRSLTRPA